jgi:hypothetical protein
MSYLFGYPSPKKRRLPLSWTRVPDFDDLAQMLAAEYATKLGTASSIAFVTHSQGGLILQRFLAWMISEGRGRELARIGTVIMLACPNGGSQYLASICHALGYGRHPQAANLEVLNKQVPDAQRVVLARVVHASGADDHQCRIPFHVYAAGSDAIVCAASAQAAFPGASTLAGNHFTILNPATPGNRTADVVSSPLACPNAPRRQVRPRRDPARSQTPDAPGAIDAAASPVDSPTPAPSWEAAILCDSRKEQTFLRAHHCASLTAGPGSERVMTPQLGGRARPSTAP